METTIKVYIDNSQYKAYEADLRRLLATLKKAVAGSPYVFEIIGQPAPPAKGKIPSSIANKAYRDLIEQLLFDANYKTNPRVYSKKILGGMPLPQRVSAALPAANSMREQAVKDYLAASQPIPGATTRSQATMAYNVAMAIFGDNILKYRK